MRLGKKIKPKEVNELIKDAYKKGWNNCLFELLSLQKIVLDDAKELQVSSITIDKGVFNVKVGTDTKRIIKKGLVN